MVILIFIYVLSQYVSLHYMLFYIAYACVPGAINITYETVKGSRHDLALTESALAEPGQDFLSAIGSLVMQDGQTSLAIPVTIIDVR